MVEIPCKDMDDPLRKKTTTMRVPMILPHELLEYLNVTWQKSSSSLTWTVDPQSHSLTDLFSEL